ncbi:MAG: DNA endonuclease SmrA [Chromatocurvus sp.]
MADDEELFWEEMADVAPIRRERRVRRQPGSSADAATLAARREAAQAARGRDPNFLAEEGFDPLDPWYVLDFKRPGIQNGVFRKLKQGRYEAEARLDMHRMTVREARAELFAFMRDCHSLGLRSVMLVHGKGERKPEKERVSILKGGVDHWLREMDTVQAFHSAQPQHGGTGAVYVLLRKSAEKKRENRERFMRGRVAYEREKR